MPAPDDGTQKPNESTPAPQAPALSSQEPPIPLPAPGGDNAATGESQDSSISGGNVIQTMVTTGRGKKNIYQLEP